MDHAFHNSSCIIETHVPPPTYKTRSRQNRENGVVRDALPFLVVVEVVAALPSPPAAVPVPSAFLSSAVPAAPAGVEPSVGEGAALPPLLLITAVALLLLPPSLAMPDI